MYTMSVVIQNIVVDHLDKFLLVGEAISIIALPLQNTPKTLHRVVVDAVGHTRHTLRHPSSLKFVMKGSAGILEPSITMEQGVNIRIGLNGLIKGFVDKRIVITLTQHIGHDTSIIEIQNGTQI